ncbi:dihydrolipoamide acetyltransferase family protein [Bacillus massiliglaciei]|uniref:dihydrolipoamide acetyltransferase family protein n=1 Tax=Bacillus massiliglaciei TaxID=1816693 RepID=UPI000A8756F1|nr:dihydrolipoamide acetyltransferase family protein [Bacillus massiliglaciei]
MAIEKMKMPQLGESVTEGTISKWLVHPGEHVNKYDPIAEVMTDKVSAEIPSSFTGVIKELKAAENETMAVGDIICLIDAESNEDAENKAPEQSEAKAAAPDVKEQPDESQKARYSPAVLKMSQEHGIDLTQVKGSGKGGRITRKDLQQIIASGYIPEAAPKAEETKAPKPESADHSVPEQNGQKQASYSTASGDVEIPVSGIRKAIAANMVKSKQEVPHAWTMVEVDATNLVRYRDAIKKEFKASEGYNLTYFAFFVKAAAQALKEFPEINSMWDGDRIIRKKEINLSIAVASEDALFVPVIKHADEKTIKGIAREITDLAQKARTGKLTAQDMQGGTFTVNNTGSFGSVQSMGIINHPQAAILQVETIVKRPVIIDGMIAVRDMVNLCLSLDHRVLDGLICGRFLARVKEIVEKISSENTPIY